MGGGGGSDGSDGGNGRVKRRANDGCVGDKCGSSVGRRGRNGGTNVVE